MKRCVDSSETEQDKLIDTIGHLRHHMVRLRRPARSRDQ